MANISIKTGMNRVGKLQTITMNMVEQCFVDNERGNFELKYLSASGTKSNKMYTIK